MSGLRVGVSLQTQDHRVVQQASEYEARGFDLLAVADHLFNWRRPERPFLDGWMQLAAIAVATRTTRLTSLVTNLAWRSPIQVVKNTIGVDQLSAGRFELGVGCGAFPDQRMAGMFEMTIRERIARLDEGTEVIDRLLKGDTRPFAGRFTRYSEAHVAPGCVQQPRPLLLVAAAGPRALSIAARFADIWNCATVDGDLDSIAATLRERCAILDAACERFDRDPATVRRSLLLWSADTDPWKDKGAFERLIERFIAVGFTDFIALSPPSEQSDVLDHFTQNVLPTLRRERASS
jgi:alkanesulfonate monooxygenase SsuD/methylene tetrahydromethanopterin reductase-like flavin-dependent oxidoreductase (luciferase family)